ncbi:hypothetical protein OS493_037614 [Desmophyllum pertusum]|uniref:Uncharacterized protein n=1 Tax=Desmophyllum pertusum TaxID=174260 RepID=A0A9W9ZI93_9CNID|nr:hypothetical protein OS493_037614 [Desmophyllum pertusum]
MIIGMLLISALTAQISSSITADGLRRLDDVFGNKVGVPLGSKKFFAKHSYGVDSLTEYSTESELLKSLENDAMEKNMFITKCFGDHSKGRNREGIKRPSSEKKMELVDYVLLACAGFLVTLVTIGSLWNSRVRIREKEKTADNSADIEKGAFGMELEEAKTVNRRLTTVST